MFFSTGSWKFVGGFLAIIALALAGLAVSDYFFNPERQAARDLKNLERQYAEDTYGGTTPEETLELFIKALESGDIELASKYFIVDKREEWHSNISKVQSNNNIDEMLNDLRRAQKTTQEDARAIFVITNDEKIVSALISLARGPTGVWKITDM